MHAANIPPELPGFIKTQYAFAAAVRDPKRVAVPMDVATERLAVYQELVFNNIEEFLANAYPVLRQICAEHQWQQLVRDFIIEHRARTPLFPEMPREFLDYLSFRRTPHNSDFPFLQELADYEWAELAIGIREMEMDDSAIDGDGDLLHGAPALSPLTYLGCYHFPVHRIGPEFIPAEPNNTPVHLLVYRNREEEVKFLELNLVAAQLLQRIEANEKQTGIALLTAIAEEINHPNPATVIESGGQLLMELRTRDVILGTIRDGAMS